MTNHRTGKAWWWIFRAAAVAIILAAVLGLSACSPNFSVPQSGSTFVVPAENAQGGSLDDFELHRRALNANKNPIEIRRDIYSAATFYLAGDVSCISPDVKVGYHGPINSGVFEDGFEAAFLHRAPESEHNYKEPHLRHLKRVWLAGYLDGLRAIAEQDQGNG